MEGGREGGREGMEGGREGSEERREEESQALRTQASVHQAEITTNKLCTQARGAGTGLQT